MQDIFIYVVSPSSSLIKKLSIGYHKIWQTKDTSEASIHDVIEACFTEQDEFRIAQAAVGYAATKLKLKTLPGLHLIVVTDGKVLCLARHEQVFLSSEEIIGAL